MKRAFFSSMNAITTTDLNLMIEQAGLDFNVEKRKIYMDDEDNSVVLIPDKMAVRRIDTKQYLATNGKDYEVYQYRDLFSFTDVLVKNGEASYVAGKAIGNGEKAVLVMKTNDCFNLGVGDDIDCFFYVATSHDMTITLDCEPLFLRKQSNTVLTMPQTRPFRCKHTKNMAQRVAIAKNNFARIKKYWEEATINLKMFAQAKLTLDEVAEYFKAVVPDPGPGKENTRAENVREKMMVIYATNPACRVATCAGTVAGAYFAACIYADEYASVRKNGRLNEEDSFIQSQLSGNAAEKKAKAYSMAAALLKL